MTGDAGIDLQQALTAVDDAAASARLSSTAADNIRQWLTEPRYVTYAPQVVQHIDQQKWQALDDAFWTVIPFGTGGRRGRMYPIGSNAINDRTIGESAQGLADYVKEHHEAGTELACAIAYDTRHRSRHFAELCAGIMAGAGFKVYFLDGYRSTPELSYLVRHKNCHCGIMVTASHNPPSDNAVKVYWSSGAQVLPPHDRGIIDRVMKVEDIVATDFAEAVDQGQVVFCQQEVDAAYVAQVQAQSQPGPRDLRIIYSPLHGVGASAVLPVLEASGFAQVELFEPHAELSGDFPNVPDHVSNPENPAVFEQAIERAQQTGAELILATDPDCDRMGCAAPLSNDPTGAWATLNGNQLGALLAEYTLSRHGALSPDHYVVKTLVTTEMIRRIADHYGVRTCGNLLVGFKWIAQTIDEQGPDGFVFGTEESHGFLVGQYARDKDGAVACMLISELAAKVKEDGQSLHEKLDALYWQFGYHAERLLTVKMEGSEGMSRMRKLMDSLRSNPPSELAGMPVAAIRDYLEQQTTLASGETQPLDGPQDNLVIIDLQEQGNYIAARPSGTEPKVKFYMFGYQPAELISDLALSKQQMDERLTGFEAAIAKIVDRV